MQERMGSEAEMRKEALIKLIGHYPKGIDYPTRQQFQEWVKQLGEPVVEAVFPEQQDDGWYVNLPTGDSVDGMVQRYKVSDFTKDPTDMPPRDVYFVHQRNGEINVQRGRGRYTAFAFET